MMMQCVLIAFLKPLIRYIHLLYVLLIISQLLDVKISQEKSCACGKLKN